MTLLLSSKVEDNEKNDSGVKIAKSQRGLLYIEFFAGVLDDVLNS